MTIRRDRTFGIDPDALLGLFTTAFSLFVEKEAGEITNGVSERNSCARLGLHLQRQVDAAGLEGYFVDPEYNRKQGGRLKTAFDSESMQEIEITCDLVLHSRGTWAHSADNLIALEMKKKGGLKVHMDSDRRRLCLLTRDSFDGVWSADGVTHPEHVCGYVWGVFVVLDAPAGQIHVELFRRGEFVGYLRPNGTIESSAVL